MGMLGKYLDSLSDEKRDRVIEAQGIKHGNWNTCVIGTAEKLDTLTDGGNKVVRQTKDGFVYLSFIPRGLPHHYYDIGIRFDKLCLRYGEDTAIALCKTRAAKSHHISLPSSNMDCKSQSILTPAEV